MATSIDQQFIEYIIKSIVGKPDSVSIERRIDEKGVLLELSVDPEDLGRVIGKRGATAQSLRTLLRALGTKNDARYNLKIVDTGPPPSRADRPEPTEKNDTAVNSQPKEDISTEESVSDEVAKPEVIERDDSLVPDSADDDIVTEEPTEADHSSVIDKTRKELAELDDLDV